MQKKSLIIIDVQNDYFPTGAFPLADTDKTLAAIELAIEKAHSGNIPVVIVQHVAEHEAGEAPFFNPGTIGADLHSRILELAPEAPIIIKHYADSFVNTSLADTLEQLEVNELILCGMMTQNCITHTALSRDADRYSSVTVLTDATTTVSPLLHAIALHALSTRVSLGTVETSL
ncbi:cysteine hydrolase family protein [Shewanella zhangzhouensis]|uniref:cysteine hydrolase family protein n=1 Tax=Shewanella zhangzhouensis TaxID=2864213 RepID=UPI001C65EBE1|nr:isochorismatase family protein [Shewanella zhangzhouensis]QYK07035.1 isochorismatase family protein [Shewanella zhangzhouensis]